eukprot:g45294.t1
MLGSSGKASGTVLSTPTAQGATVPTVTAANVRSVFLRIHPRKATSPDGVPGCALRSSVDQLADVFTDVSNLSLLHAEATCFKKTTIIVVPKKIHATCLNELRPVILTSRIMKCFERVVMVHFNLSLPGCLDPLQFAYRCNRKKGGEHSHIHINRADVERVDSVKFLGVDNRQPRLDFP